ncbi:MAG TPA: phosphatidylglycerol lysyltransferase domain-containing protein [Micromonosporaceae bacterium]|nr:phosphatidylglycerol lysyltransferase domain-containing protein [Micromonosporaceae bacterium]
MAQVGSAVAQARLLGLLVMAAGATTVASALFPPWRGRVRLAEELLTVEGTGLATGAAILVGLGLILVGRGVAQRRRLACHATIALLVAASLTHLAKGFAVEEAAVTAALAGVLWWRRSLFVVPLPPGRLGTLGRIAVAMVTLDLGYGVIGLVWQASRGTALTPRRVAGEVTAGLAGLPGPAPITGHFGHWFPVSLTAMGMATVSTLLLIALAPVALRGGGPPTERDEVSRLLDRADGDTLDPFILRYDKRWIFSVRRDAALGYRYVNGVGLASGDPVGDPADFPDAVREFLDLCECHGWRPALVGARVDRLPLYQRMGLRAIYIGAEAVINVDRYSLDGRRMRNVRQAVHRARNAGATTQILPERELDPALRRTLLGVASAQRAEHREFGYFMALGDLLTGAYPDCLIVVCRDRTGEPVAFQRYTQCQAGRALSLDTMRRTPGGPNGVNEAMIVGVVDWARAHGVSQMSLNFAAFCSLFDPAVERRPGQALEALLIQSLEGRFGIQMNTLRRFNAKFQPEWIPRYLIYRSLADLPAIGLAALSAEGFLPFDRTRLP